MDFNEYQKESKRTWRGETGEPFFRAILGLCGEAGEIAEKVKKSYRDNFEIDSEDMGKELGDVLYYITRTAEYYGLTLEEVAKMNIKKLADRANRGKIRGSGDTR